MHGNRTPESRSWLACFVCLGCLWPLAGAHAGSFDGNHYYFAQPFLPPTPVIENFERLGSSFAIGDFDNDGNDDLAVAEPYAEIDLQPSAGKVYVFFSSGSAQIFATPLSFDPGPAQTGVRFGFSLAAGDFDLDGIEDLAIGVPDSPRFFANAAGEVQIRFGGNGGFSGTGQVLELEVPQAQARFGFSLVAADVSPNGIPGLADTLLVGIPGHDFDLGAGETITAAGAFAWFDATPSGLTFDNVFFQDVFGGAIEADDSFAEVLAAGDFNGDGIDDFAIGTPREDIGTNSNAGAVSVTVSGEKGRTSFTFSQNDLTGTLAEESDGFGTALAIGDFDGDGNDDLAIGTPFEGVSSTNGAGLVQVVHGVATTGLDLASASTWTQESTGVAVSEPSDFFGSALQAGDFDGDGEDDLAIGIPYEDFGAANAGAVVALFGTSPGGLTATDAKLLLQSDFGGVNQQDDLFGGALGGGDFDNDGTIDLAVGVPREDAGAIDAGAFFVLFGESLFADGFESGDTSAWSASFP